MRPLEHCSNANAGLEFGNAPANPRRRLSTGGAQLLCKNGTRIPRHHALRIYSKKSVHQTNQLRMRAPGRPTNRLPSSCAVYYVRVEAPTQECPVRPRCAALAPVLLAAVSIAAVAILSKASVGVVSLLCLRLHRLRHARRRRGARRRRLAVRVKAVI